MKKIQTIASALLLVSATYSFGQSTLYKKLDNYSGSVRNEFGQISADRKEKLDEVASQLNKANSEGKSYILFASADNSASSQLAQAWLEVAKASYRLNNLEITSGGEQTSAINKEAINALKNAGFRVEANTQFKNNPRYTVGYSPKENTLLMFSKKYDNFQNPTTGFVAVGTQENLADVQGGVAKIDLPYESNANLNEQSKQIAREMFYLAEKLQSKNLLSHQQ